MSRATSPSKRLRNAASSSALNASSNFSSYSRPHTPLALRRPASSLSIRSATPLLIRPRSTTPFGSRDDTGSYQSNIKVAVRVRPNDTNEYTCAIDTTLGTVYAPEVGEYTFDSVFDDPDNVKVFDACVKDVADKVLQGFHGTVFAYGMTGSGKTYSMQGTQLSPGLIPQSVNYIFDQLAKSPRSFRVAVSYLEIYNEQLYDLLRAPGSVAPVSDQIKLRDDPHRGVKAVGLSEVQVSSPQELLDLIARGDALRRTEGTDFNARSSRSHAVVQIHLESFPKNPSNLPGAKENMSYASSLYLCDLAGSERAVSQNERRKEGSFINKSLLTLGTVIARLSSSSTSAGHIPYRDSKLTRLLQPALSGKSIVSVLVTIHGTPTSHIETLSTLRFAARAKNIVIAAKRNEDPAMGAEARAMVERLTQQLELLKMENEQLKRNGGHLSPKSDSSSTDINTGSGNGMSSQLALLTAENKILHERVEHLTRLCDDSKLDELLGISGEDKGSVKAQIDEYKSYITHLEKQLYEKYKSSEASPDLSLEYGFGHTSNYYQEMIKDLKEEVRELKENNLDKDSIIDAMRALNKRRENLYANHSNDLSQNNSASSAYSRYYSTSGFSSVPSEPDDYSSRPSQPTFSKTVEPIYEH